MINRNIYCLALSLLLNLLTTGFVNAQCNNQVDLSTDCDFLFLLDGTIVEDGICSTLPAANPIDELTPFCLDLSSSENTGFFLIEPVTSSLYLRIIPMNCTEVEIAGQFFAGMQAAIFSDCSFENMKACAPLCNSNEFIIGSDDFIPFQTYLLAFDGCNGSVCDFEIEVQSGALSEIIPLVDPKLDSPMEVCSNETNRISIAGLPALTDGNWTIDGVIFQTLFNGKAIEINDWGAAGLKEICAQIQDPQSGEMYFDSCWTVDVIQAPIINDFPQESALCFEDDLSLFIEGAAFSSILWSGPGLNCNNCPTPTLTMPDSSIVIQAMVSNNAGCQEVVELPFALTIAPNCFVGLDDININLDLNIAPNPFQENVTFFLEEKSNVKIYNLSGHLVFEGKNIEGDQRLETSSWATGLYLIEVKSDSGIGSQRLLKL